jgi:hypothetical protein
MAKLGLFTTIVRAKGTGRWHRERDGKWIMDRFTIQSFDPLKVVPLTQAIAKLRAIAGPELERINDPLAELEKIRHGS